MKKDILNEAFEHEISHLISSLPKDTDSKEYKTKIELVGNLMQKREEIQSSRKRTAKDWVCAIGAIVIPIGSIGIGILLHLYDWKMNENGMLTNESSKTLGKELSRFLFPKVK